jgi:hypothetical protein
MDRREAWNLQHVWWWTRKGSLSPYALSQVPAFNLLSILLVQIQGHPCIFIKTKKQKVIDQIKFMLQKFHLCTRQAACKLQHLPLPATLFHRHNAWCADLVARYSCLFTFQKWRNEGASGIHGWPMAVWDKMHPCASQPSYTKIILSLVSRIWALSNPNQAENSEEYIW